MHFQGFEVDGRKQFKRIAVSFNLSCCIVKLRELHKNTHSVTNWTGRYVENQRYVFVPKGKVYCLVFLTTDDFIPFPPFFYQFKLYFERSAEEF